MRSFKKKDFPVSDIRRFLEPGPIVLVSSALRGRRNVMTLGWQTVMEFTPSLVGCVISRANFSHELIRKSRECVLNVPTVELATKVVGIGNCSGREVDKFATFELTAVPAARVKAPLIAECHSSFECRLVDTRLVHSYDFFVFECVQAHVAPSPRFPRTLHYRGEGLFMLSGPTVAVYRRLFRPEML
ncbi:MAG: flavin reductase family protein [Myxococcales bacterium]